MSTSSSPPTRHHPNYELIGNVVNSQIYVSTYALHDYPVNEANILHRGEDAWNAALNTVNVGKYNLGCAGVGLGTHAFYEAINHAANRVLYGRTSPTSRTSAGCSPTPTRGWWR